MLTTRTRISIAAPSLVGNERAYVLDCLEHNQLSGGTYVRRFEEAFAAVCQVKHAIACSSGTAALHLALVGLHLSAPWTEVIIPATTFIATANAVRYAGARPVIVDVGRDWCIDPIEIERAITPNTRAVIAVHLFGQPAAMDAIREIAQRHRLRVIEDAAEAHGALDHDRPVGGLGDAGCFSFFGNKILTCGEGGMVTTNDAALAERIRALRGHAMDPDRRYWHTEIGFNYRLTDLQAAVGLAQVEQLDWHLARRSDVWEWYDRYLPSTARMQPNVRETFSAHWMVAVELADTVTVTAADARARLADDGIETRPIFPPLNKQESYWDWRMLPRAERLYQRGIVLPTHAGLNEDDVRFIGERLSEVAR